MIIKVSTQKIKNNYMNVLILFEKNEFNLKIFNVWKNNYNIKNWRNINFEKFNINVQLKQKIKRF